MVNWKQKTSKLGLLLGTSLLFTLPMAADTVAADNCSIDASGDRVCSDANNGSTGELSSTSSSTPSIPSVLDSRIKSLATTKVNDAIKAANSSVNTDSTTVAIIPTAQSEQTADELGQTIKEIIDELDPELKPPLINAISAAITALGETFKEQIRQEQITKEAAEEKLRALVKSIIEEANKLEEETEAAAQAIKDKEAKAEALAELEEKKAQNADLFAQKLYDFVNKNTKDPNAPTPTAGATTASDGNGSFSANWDGPGTPSGKLAVYGPGKSYYKPVQGDYKGADNSRFNYEFRQHGTKGHPKMDPKLYASLDLMADLIQKQGWKDVRYSITSGYRSAAYNRGVNGAKKSQHIQYKAGDIKAFGVNSENRVRMVPPPLTHAAACKVRNARGKGGVGSYTGFTHVDTRNYKANWGSRAGKCAAQK